MNTFCRNLLYQFTETPATIELLEMFQVSPEELREELTMFFENKVERVGECDISFSASVLRIFSRTEQQVVSSGRECLEITDLFVALFSEEQSFAVYLLRRNEIEIEDVLSERRRRTRQIRVGIVCGRHDGACTERQAGCGCRTFP